MKDENKELKCFIITPIGSDNTDVRRRADGVITSVLKPVLSDYGFTDVSAAHEINKSGSINNQIMERIVYDDLVIANLTGLNPNVMYELAVRHSTCKPIIHICEENQKMPFDLYDQRTIFYKNDMLGVTELGKKLKIILSDKDVLNDNNDNPIYNSIEHKIFIDEIDKNPDMNFEKYLNSKLEHFESLLTGNNKYVSKNSYDYIENFIININIDSDYVFEVLKFDIEQNLKDYYENIFEFKIVSTKELTDEIGKYINVLNIDIFITIASNREIPYIQQIYSLLDDYSYHNIEILNIKGNKVPF